MANVFDTWGKCDRHGAQGWAVRWPDRRFWQANYSIRNSPVYYPWAVTDDYGDLVPVPYQ